ncbi:9250_t:CDS:1, partial [Gigaspora rosea]
DFTSLLGKKALAVFVEENSNKYLLQYQILKRTKMAVKINQQIKRNPIPLVPSKLVLSSTRELIS